MSADEGTDFMGRERRPSNRLGKIQITAAVVVLGLLAAACTLPGFAPAPIPPEQRAQYDAAMGNLPSNPAAATEALQTFLATYPRSQLADDAMEQLSQLAFAKDRQEEGIRLLGQIITEYPRGDRAPTARLRLAEIEFGRDRRTVARRLLDPLDIEKLTPPEQNAALRLGISLARTPVERMETLTRLRNALQRESDVRTEAGDASDESAEQIAKLDREIAALIASAASPELEEMMRGLRSRPPAPAIALELSIRALDSGQLKLASRRIDRASSLVSRDLDEAQLRLLTERLVLLLEAAEADAELPALREISKHARPRTKGAEGTVGVVLPLSGDFAAYGQESLRGILMAASLFDGSAGGGTGKAASATAESVWSGEDDADPADERGIRLVVRDSQGDPVKAAAFVRELADDSEVLAIVGPIFTSESLGAAEAAEQMDVPLVTLSTKEEVAAGRTQVFRTRTTPGDEVRVLVSHAFEKMGAKRFAVLYPESRYGRGMRKLYWDEVTARGGEMVAASSYDPEATDFSTAIRDMIGYRFLTRWEKKALGQRSDILRAARNIKPAEAAILRKAAYNFLGPEGDPLPPIVDFDVLFIPDASDKIALVAPGLAFHEIRGVKLLGTNDWLDPELLRVARRHLSGSVISTPFYPESDVPIISEFVEGYRATFGDDPGAYAAQAFDATNLILVQLASGRSNRSGIRDGLLDTRAYPGATGVLSMRPDGNARRRPFLLEVSGRRFESLD